MIDFGLTLTRNSGYPIGHWIQKPRNSKIGCAIIRCGCANSGSRFSSDKSMRSKAKEETSILSPNTCLSWVVASMLSRLALL